jgi:hypothetical protein
MPFQHRKSLFAKETAPFHRGRCLETVAICFFAPGGGVAVCDTSAPWIPVPPALLLPHAAQPMPAVPTDNSAIDR